MRESGEQSAQRAHYLADRLSEIPGVELAGGASFVREFAVRLPVDPVEVIRAMAERGYLAGISVTADYPELPRTLVVAVTEKRSRAELDGYVQAMREVVENA